MTAPAKAARNGTTTTASAPERKSGIVLVPDAEVYHLASVARDAAFEAERLCSAIHRTASEVYLKHEDEPGDHWAQAAERDRQAEEALRCLDTAQRYLRQLISGQSPF